MKTTSIIKLAAILIAVIGISFAGCKKDKTTTSTDTTSMQQLTQDEQTVENASDDILNDANDVLTVQTAKEVDSTNMPCHVTLDSVYISGGNKIFDLTFNGLNCKGNKLRDGQMQIVIPTGTKWKDPGAKCTINLTNLKITRVLSGKWIILNGTKTFENVSGGKIINLGNGVSSITHQITGNLQIAFMDGTTRAWTVARQRVFTGSYAAGTIIMTVSGLGSDNGYNNLVVWGTNRANEAFYTQILTPVAYDEVCGGDPCVGQVIHQVPAKTKSCTVTFGYDNTNQPVTNGNCPSRYKVDWVIGSNNGTLYLPLP